jgi:hypothetical protein
MKRTKLATVTGENVSKWRQFLVRQCGDRWTQPALTSALPAPYRCLTCPETDEKEGGTLAAIAADRDHRR